MLDEYIGKRLADKYEIDELVRPDSVGNLYSGKHLLMDKPVLVMVLSRSLAVDELIVEKFSEEARRMARLSHPNLLNVTDFGRDYDGTVFVVMENVGGESLQSVLRREGALSVERSVRIARQIAAGLSAMHAAGMIHRKLSSETVLLTEMANGSELVKIVDIGSFIEPVETVFTDEETHVDALFYMSPELCAGETEPDERSDVYSLGIIFYEMLIGEVPFTADSPMELMLKHAEVPPPPFAAFRDDVSVEIEPVAIRAVAKNPDMRYQTSGAFAEDLTHASRVEGEDQPIIVPPKPAASRNNLWKTAFIVLSGISIVAAVLIFLFSRKGAEPITVQAVDKNGTPVQPLNPATGTAEKNIQQDMNLYTSGSMSPEDLMMRPEFSTTGGGGGYDPWANPGSPPSGGPIGAPSGSVNIPAGSNSLFMQDEPVGYDDRGNPIYLVPVPKASPSPDSTAKTKDPKKTDPNGEPPKEATVDPKKPNDSKKPADSKADPSKPASPKPSPAPPTKSQNSTESGREKDI